MSMGKYSIVHVSLSCTRSAVPSKSGNPASSGKLPLPFPLYIYIYIKISLSHSYFSHTIDFSVFHNSHIIHPCCRHHSQLHSMLLIHHVRIKELWVSIKAVECTRGSMFTTSEALTAWAWDYSNITTLLQPITLSLLTVQLVPPGSSASFCIQNALLREK